MTKQVHFLNLPLPEFGASKNSFVAKKMTTHTFLVFNVIKRKKFIYTTYHKMTTLKFSVFNVVK